MTYKRVETLGMAMFADLEGRVLAQVRKDNYGLYYIENLVKPNPMQNMQASYGARLEDMRFVDEASAANAWVKAHAGDAGQEVRV